MCLTIQDKHSNNTRSEKSQSKGARKCSLWDLRRTDLFLLNTSFVREGGCYTPPLLGWKFLISPRRLRIFLWNFDNVNKTSLETFWHPQVRSLKYLLMRKLQLLSVTYNLQAKFLMEKTRASIFSIFSHGMKFKLTLEIPTDKWSRLVTRSTWSREIVWKWFLVYKLRISQVTNRRTSSRVITGPSFNFISFMEVKSLRGVCTHPFYEPWM